MIILARKLVNTFKMPHSEWLEHRRNSIGGSEASTIVGLNPYNSLYALWADKKGLLPEKCDNEAMRQGRDLEEYVAKRFCEKTGKKVRRTNFMYLHDDYDFISANVDREVVGENAGLECKTTSVLNKSDFENGEVPLTYYCQCQHYMAVMGYERMYLAVLVLNKGFYDFVIERNNEEITTLIKEEKAFWNKYIIGDDIPEVDGSEATEKALDEIYPESLFQQVNIADKQNIVNKLIEIKNTISDCKKIEEQYKQELQLALGDAEKGITETHLITWKTQTSNRVDSTRLKKELPDIYNNYLKSTTSRVFRVDERRLV